MQSKGIAPTASEKRYREEVRALGCICSHMLDIPQPPVIEIHHMMGASAKDSGIRVGHILILPLSPGFHRTYQMHIDGYPNVTSEKHYFDVMFGGELELFAEMIMLLGYDPFERMP